MQAAQAERQWVSLCFNKSANIERSAFTRQTCFGLACETATRGATEISVITRTFELPVCCQGVAVLEFVRVYLLGSLVQTSHPFTTRYPFALLEKFSLGR
ncbi:unnamed protein product [Sphagnum balticum]